MLRSVVLLVIFLFTFNVFGAERVILLAPAAADIFEKLGCAEYVAGKTKSVSQFPDAFQVGSHIRPNLELIMSLKPDLIVIPSNRFFTEEMVREAGVPVFEYDPVTLDEILIKIRELGDVMGRSSEAAEIISQMLGMLEAVKPVAVRPSVLFEVMEIPYTLAGRGNIVSDIIARAGGDNMVDDRRKMVRFSLEKAVEMNPAFYIWQVGPMNKQPVDPAVRAEFRTMSAEFIQVDETSFSRANTNSFVNLLELNRLFLTHAEEIR
jgi:iron complex transport system substrate-binding protein